MSAETAFAPTYEHIPRFESTVNASGVETNDKSMEKKKRNSRKRNRSDMSPEELTRLRERERKAQQSRRDRIRAQKKLANGWHNDDAAWEAFLGQSGEDSKNKLPSMVNPKSFEEEKTEESPPPPLVNGYSSDDKYSPQTQQETDSNSDLASDHQTSDQLASDQPTSEMPVVYSSDDNSDEKKVSHRHFLPADELERLRRRERDAKRKQREKIRLAKSEQANNSSGTESTEVKCEVKTEETERPSEEKKTHSPESVHETRIISPYRPPIVSPHNHMYHRHSYHTSPTHDYHPFRSYPGVHFPRDTHPYPHFYPMISPPSSEKMHLDRPHDKDADSGEKKRVISRNVDRKTLSEEELEDLRKRERNYQRERRARIRMEKAKSQINQDLYEKTRHEAYYHRSLSYMRPHEDHMRPREDHHMHHHFPKHSPPPYHHINRFDEHYAREKELVLKIPNVHREDHRHDDSGELLQVVPLTRDSESSKGELSMHDKENDRVHKKFSLEDICSSLKKGSDDDSDNKLVVVHPNTEKENFSDSNNFKCISSPPEPNSALDQLERRRRSNREAQRRRRARLKMQSEQPMERVNEWKHPSLPKHHHHHQHREAPRFHYPSYHHRERAFYPEHHHHHHVTPHKYSPEPPKHEETYEKLSPPEQTMSADESDLSKQGGGRKRKQMAPRKIVNSSGTTPEQEDIDVCGLTIVE